MVMITVNTYVLLTMCQALLLAPDMYIATNLIREKINSKNIPSFIYLVYVSSFRFFTDAN